MASINKIHTFLLGCFLLATANVFAQSTTITGKVVEENGGQPIAFATVMVADNETKKPVDGTTTLDDGSFTLETDAISFYIEISFLGFQTKTFGQPPTAGETIDLGTIALSEDAEQLQEVVVEGEISRTEFKLDKRVFNVGKDLSTTGASALEVLNNVPSVNVNIEGQVSLRGSRGVQMLINGKPSIIASEEGNALGTITADMIDRVEVITNPSAKYNAEGTSGIINIVLKKEERKGLNGSVSVNTGTPAGHSVGVSLNRRTEKFNLFSQLGVGLRDLPNDIETRNVDLVNNTTILSNGTEYRNETYYNFVLGTDYHINDKNVLTLSGNFALEIEDQPSNTSFAALDSNGEITSQWERNEVTEANNPKFQYELQYKKEFQNDEDHTLLFSGLGNFFGKDQSSEFINTTIAGTDRDDTQQTRTDFKEAVYTFKLDYTNPFTEKWTMETGAQYVLNDVSNDYEVNNLINGSFVNDTGLTNIFNYDQKVLGLYGTGSYEGEKWGVKGGVRLDVGRRAALAGFISLAPDALTPLGGYPGNDDDGRELQSKRDRNEMLEDFIAGFEYLKSHPDCTGKVGVVGFCFGGWISNMMAVKVPDLAAAVPFYGGQPTEGIEKIKAPLLLHFGELDTRVNEGWPAYEAAELAWQRTIDFFKEKLG